MNPAMDNLRVANSFIPNTKNWHMENIRLLFDDVLAYHISSTPLLASVQHDRVFFANLRKTEFTRSVALIETLWNMILTRISTG